MINRKTALGYLMALVMLSMQAGAVYAAPISQATTIDGTIQSITQSPDPSGNTIFVVKILDSSGKTQTVSLSATSAVSLGLVTANPDGTYTINNVVGTHVSIPISDVIASPCSTKETGIVSAALAAFFCQGGSTVLDNSVDALHAEGFGFGEIAQACFMAEALGTTCGDILTAKSSHDFSTLGLPTDVTVKNWGQLKRYAMAEDIKSLTNLGAIMSGRATAPTVNPTPGPTPTGPIAPNANGNGNGNNGHGHGQGGNGKGNGNGNGHKP